MASKKGQRSPAASSRSQKAGQQRTSKGPPDPIQAGRNKGERQRKPSAAGFEVQQASPPGEAASRAFGPFEAMMRTATAFAEVAMASTIGAMVGATRGAIEGGLAGLERPEQSGDWFDDNYWRESFDNLPYVNTDVLYGQYRPAFQFGWQQAIRNPGASFEELDEGMAQAWDRARGSSTLAWEEARDAARDAFERAAENMRS